MPLLNSKRQIRYTVADVNAVAGAMTLCEFIAEFDTDGKQDATTAFTALKHVAEHIKQVRTPANAAVK